MAFAGLVSVPGSEQAALLLTAGQFDWLAHRASEPFRDLFPTPALLARARHWCSLLDHPAYDCLYIALAEQQNATLITAEQRLLRKLQEPHAGLPASLDAARPGRGEPSWST